MSEELQRKAISVQEFTKITGVSGSTIRKWLRDGELKAVKPGKRKWLIPVSELQRLINA
jgi:excisionase family DNA binding protein